MLSTLPPLSLYVHLPWCISKCPYCDFNSHTAGRAAPFDRYVQALLADIEREATRASGRALQSIFLGGGTPSLFPAHAIAQVIDRIAEAFELADDVEITMEANPGTVECAAPSGYRAAGINRLSIGAQSFSDEALRRIGRIHDVSDIRASVTSARTAGFENINIDLMYALPGQRPGAALEDIERAAELEPTHISWYQLTLEPNTVFHVRPPGDLPDDDAVADVQERGRATLEGLGFRQYEVSAYAREGWQCRHNLNYWRFGDYLAVGAGAHGKVSVGHGICRYVRPVNPLSYMQAIERMTAEPELEALAADELTFEFMLNALRLKSGFEEGLFAERTGLSIEALREGLAAASGRGLIEPVDTTTWRPTALGYRFLNDLQAAFLPSRGAHIT